MCESWSDPASTIHAIGIVVDVLFKVKIDQ